MSATNTNIPGMNTQPNNGVSNENNFVPSGNAAMSFTQINAQLEQNKQMDTLYEALKQTAPNAQFIADIIKLQDKNRQQYNFFKNMLDNLMLHNQNAANMTAGTSGLNASAASTATNQQQPNLITLNGNGTTFDPLGIQQPSTSNANTSRVNPVQANVEAPQLSTAISDAITFGHLSQLMPTYSGRDNPRAHWQMIKLTAAPQGVTDVERLVPFLKRSLTGPAQTWYRSFMKTHPLISNTEFLQAFLTEYPKPNYRSQCQLALTNAKMSPNETFHEFCNRIVDLALKVDKNMPDDLLISYVTNGLLEQYKLEVLKFRAQNLNDLKQGLKLLDGIYFNNLNNPTQAPDVATVVRTNLITSPELTSITEHFIKQKDIAESNPNAAITASTNNIMSTVTASVQNLAESLGDRLNSLTASTNLIQNMQKKLYQKTDRMPPFARPQNTRMQQMMQGNPNGQMNRNGNGSLIICSYCNATGHKKFECRKYQATQNNANAPRQPILFGPQYVPNRPQSSQLTCSYCGQFGHAAEKCFRNPNTRRVMPPFNRPTS